MNKIIETIKVMMQKSNVGKISVLTGSMNPIYFMYKHHFFKIQEFPLTQVLTGQNELPNYQFEVFRIDQMSIDRLNHCLNNEDYREILSILDEQDSLVINTNERKYWDPHSKNTLNQLFDLLGNKVLNIDEILDNILDDDEEERIPF